MARGFLAAAVLLLSSGIAHAERLAPEKVPAPLRPWIEWALRGHEAELCPDVAGARSCSWPARLSLDLGAEGGRFAIGWMAEARDWVPLPGDDRHWPQDLTLDGKPAVATARDSLPFLRLEKGAHAVAGAFQWDSLPEILRVPPEIGVVALTIDGQAVAFPNRDEAGQLWLRKRVEEAKEESRLEVRVQRLVTDDVPLTLATRITLDVSGPSRETLLGKPLPAGFIPTSLETPLPARVESDGRLRVQLRAGSWTLTLAARHEGQPAPIALAPIEPPWDAEEVWAFDARPSLRLVTIEGVPAIDPQQSDLPDEWKRLPAYLVRPGAAMVLVEKRRGDADPAPDRLSLERTWWLDFDGRGLTIRDRLTGTMARGWRLEMGPPTVLGRVAIDGRDQFLTRLAGGEPVGVEIRQGAVAVDADSRLEGDVAASPAVGWSHDFQAVSGELELPPGWRLFHASGVDGVSSSWIRDWSLLDLYLVLMIAVAAGRLWGAAWGTIALAALGLAWFEPGAPRWIWLAVIVGEALMRVLPEGRARRLVGLYRIAAIAVAGVIAVPFATQQLRQGLFPALEQPWISVAPGAPAPAPLARKAAVVGGIAEGLPAAPAEIETAASGLEDRGRVHRKGMRQSVDALGAPEADRYAAIDPNARISTGPGLPRWSWRSIRLEWRGPVEHGQTLRLWLMPPGLNAVLAFLRVALLAALLARIVGGLRSGGSGAPGALATAIALALLVPLPARADDFPPAPLLDELRARLTEPHGCEPACAAIPRLRLEVSPSALVARVEVAAEAPTAVPLPGGARSWIPERVVVDDDPAPGLRRGGDGSLWIEVAAGDHQVLMEGRLPDLDGLEIPLPLRPHRVEAKLTGWTIAGIGEDGVPESNLELSRTRDNRAAAAAESLQPGNLPPFLRVERRLRLGLAWEVDTAVVRVTPAGTAIVAAVPLLEGESVTTADLHVEGGKVTVSLGPQATFAGWHSVVKPAPEIRLAAADAAPWTEVWTLDVSPLWHAEAKGFPPVHAESGGGPRVREWRPWPGESVTVTLSRPAGIAGPTLTLDRSSLEVMPGLRATDAKLTLEMRSSRGGQHRVRLPEGTELTAVTIGGVAQPIRLEKGTVTLPIAPGSQTAEIAWREPRGIGARLVTPPVDAGAPSVNAEVTVAMPADRWTLLVSPSRLGPVVLFWALVLALALVAAGLARIRSTPLGAKEWFLLGIGLSQASIVAAAVVVGWIVALGWRERRGAAEGDLAFDLVQLALVVWTLAAAIALFLAIQQGLLGLPEMQIAGNGSSASLLRWYFDRADRALPRVFAISVSILWYRLAMLAWALWLARALVGWLRWGWKCFSDGGLWRPVRRPRRASGRAPA